MMKKSRRIKIMSGKIDRADIIIYIYKIDMIYLDI